VKLDNDKIKPLEKGNTILAGNAKQKYGGSSAVSVSERKQNGRTWSGRRLLIFEINRLPKMDLPGET
jgi:DNA-binding protein H-NS